MSTLKILSDTNCIVRCDFEEVGNIQAGEFYKLQLKKGCYILEFLVEDIVICSMDYTIETNDEEPLLRLNIKEQAEKKIMERLFAFVYSEDGLTIVGCNKSFEGELIVPDGVEHIANSAFEDSKATCIHIPDSVTSIGDEAFCGCSGLTSVTIGNNVTSMGNRAFKNCSDLVSVMIPNSVKSIGDYVFEGCDRLTSVNIPNSVTKIGIGAFLVNQQTPEFLKGKGYNFFGSRGLTYPLYNATLFACMPTLYSKSSYIIPDGIKEICDSAFHGCSTLVSVIIPNSVTKIGDFAFRGCSGLTSIAIPNSVKTIGHGAFASCFRLTFVTIPNSVTSIGEMAFHDCSGLISIVIPNSVTSIGEDAFYGCVNLKEIIIPKGTRAKFEEMLPDQKDKLVVQEQMAKKGTKDRMLFFDTETTGIPLNYKAPSSDTQNWPRLVQLAWILTDKEGNRIHTGNLIVKPNGFVIPVDATKVHGITTQKAKEEGIPLSEVIEQFKADLDMATFIVGHNIEFDKKIVGAEMIRLGMKDEIEKRKSYCTMQSSIDFCKIPSKYGYKYPKLQELYRKLFGENFGDAHNAMSDIEATEKCFWELKKRKLI